MYDYRNIDWLAHHGVKGQKWGVKHGPPYPLSRQKGSGRLTGKIHIDEKKDVSDDMRFTHKTPKYIQYIPGIKTKTKKDVSIYEDAKKANPKYDLGEECQTNCLYCTLTMEMRCRGYDVEAQPVNKKYDDYSYIEDLKDFGVYDGLFIPKPDSDYGMILDKNGKEIDRKPTKKETEDLKSNCISKIEKMPNNSRGEIAFYYWFDNHEDGHSVFFEKTDKGDVVIIDGQDGAAYYIDDYHLFEYSSSIGISRLDNRDIDINKVKDFCK